MENTAIAAIVVAVIAIIPGLYALMTQANKDKFSELNMVASHFHKVNSDKLNELDIRARTLEGYIADKETMPIEISEQQVKRIWDIASASLGAFLKVL